MSLDAAWGHALSRPRAGGARRRGATTWRIPSGASRAASFAAATLAAATLAAAISVAPASAQRDAGARRANPEEQSAVRRGVEPRRAAPPSEPFAPPRRENERREPPAPERDAAQGGAAAETAAGPGQQIEGSDDEGNDDDGSEDGGSERERRPSPQPMGPAYEPGGPVRELVAFDTRLDPVDPPPDLDTPRAALYTMMEGCQSGDLERAAHALDTTRLDADVDPRRVARELCYLAVRRVDVDWRGVPDHPQALSEPPEYSAAGPRTPIQTVTFGTLDLDGRPIDLRLQRVRVTGRAPMWVVAAPTVERVPALYAEHGPPAFEEDLEPWLKQEVGFGFAMWEVLGLPALFVAALLLVLLGYLLVRLITMITPTETGRRWVRRLGGPLSVLGVAFLSRVAIRDWLDLRGNLVALVERTTTLVMIVMAGWLVMRVANLASELAVERYSGSLENEQDHRARRIITQTSVLRRVGAFVIALAVVGALMIQLELARMLGTALLGTAGAISVVVAVAAHSVLGNLFAGIQVAISKPVRIGDNVMIEDEWGWVEAIHYTHLTVRTWDHRRLVVPFSHFWKTPFENWSAVSPKTVRPIYLYVDFRADVRAIRDEFVRACRAAESWDPSIEPELVVIDMTDRCVKLRCTCSSTEPSLAWDLHCLLREHMLEYLQSLDERRTWPREREERLDLAAE